jgi:methyl-accepting chemotaxis protein
MRMQGEQVTKAMREQARTAHEMTGAVNSVSQEALRITSSNRNHLEATGRIRGAVVELREITTRNAESVQATLSSTSGLERRARQLGEFMDSMVASNVTRNGNENGKSKAARSRRSKKSPATIDSEGKN